MKFGPASITDWIGPLLDLQGWPSDSEETRWNVDLPFPRKSVGKSSLQSTRSVSLGGLSEAEVGICTLILLSILTS